MELDEEVDSVRGSVTVSLLLRVAALVTFVVAALILFNILTSVTFASALGWMAVGLACWVTSTFV